MLQLELQSSDTQVRGAIHKETAFQNATPQLCALHSKIRPQEDFKYREKAFLELKGEWESEFELQQKVNTLWERKVKYWSKVSLKRH